MEYIYDELNNDTDSDIDEIIIKERNKSILEISQELEHVVDTYNIISTMIDNQKDNININLNKVENIEITINEATIDLEKSVDHDYKRLIMIRDISIVAGGGILGLSGFILGPIIGVGTIVGGMILGGVMVIGINKI